MYKHVLHCENNANKISYLVVMMALNKDTIHAEVMERHGCASVHDMDKNRRTDIHF